MNVAIVILNWNGSNLLLDYLPSVVTYSSQADIVVVDNNSTDNSVALLKELFPEVRIIQNDKNYGFAKGYNKALKLIDADLYCLLNSDVEVTDGWISTVIDCFASMPRVAVIQPKILNYKSRDTFDYAGAGGGFMDYFGYPFCRGRWHTIVEKDYKQYDDSCPIFWASGACFFIRKVVFDELGGFDEDYFSYQEEIDLCWRIQHKGYKIWYQGHSVVYHLGSGSFGVDNPRKTFYNFRNSLISLTKNIYMSRLLWLIPLRFILDGIVGLIYFFSGKFGHAWAIVKAHVSYYTTFKITMTKRRAITRKPFKYYKAFSVIGIFFAKKIFWVK